MAESGIASVRNGWCSMSSVPSSSRSGRCVSATTITAERPTLKAAVLCGTSCGSSPRASDVDAR